MKILKIRLRNLNSLKGDHVVNLDREPFAGSGLFAIVGRTGAGKTTLLDAVTLALYGKVARYGGDKPENVLNRRCGECRAEVEFLLPAGRFRATWEMRRARNKPGGVLQPPKRYVYDCDGNPLAQQVTEANAKIEELTGLDYERFLRSAMLAQGDFDRFLSAKPAERSELLEALTGTGIYSRLSEVAFREAKNREENIQAMERDWKDIVVMTAEQRTDTEDKVKAFAEKEKLQDERRKKDLEVHGEIPDLKKARKDKADAEAEIKKSEEELRQAKEDFEKLGRHELAQPFTDELARFDQAKNNHKSAVQFCKDASEDQVRGRKGFEQATESYRASMTARIVALGKELKDLDVSLKADKETEKELKNWLERRKSDLQLEEQESDLLRGLDHLARSRIDFSTKRKRWKDSIDELLPEDLANLGLDHSMDVTAMEKARPSLLERMGNWAGKLEESRKKLKEDFTLKSDHLEKSMRLASMEQHRHTLVDGEPCQLCGSLEHPYSAHAPDPGMDRIEEAKRKSEQALTQATERVSSFKLANDKILEREREMLDSRNASREAGKSLVSVLSPFAIPLPEAGKETELEDKLKERARGCRNKLNELKNLGPRIENNEVRLVPLGEKLSQINKSLLTLPVRGEEVPESPEEPSDVERALEDYDSARVQLNDAQATLKERELREKKLKVESEASGHSLQERIKDSSFESLESLVEAKLPDEQALRIRQRKNNLEKNRVEWRIKREVADSAISDLVKKKIPEGEEAEQFIAAFRDLEESLKQLRIDLHDAKNSLVADDEKKKLTAEKKKLWEDAGKALDDWKKLRELIGSADGKKFRTFAQALSLSALVSKANRHLSKLAPRYEIEVDQKESLGLQVKDLNEAGEIRPVASLSGGEKFLASLSMALGLSDLASTKISIETLFIDEGFGSLDAEYLEEAVNVLESLKHQSKTVGVISHVELLKERILVRISVETKADGSSWLNVPKPSHTENA